MVDLLDHNNLSTQCYYYYQGTHLNTIIKRFCLCDIHMIPPKRFDISPPDWRCFEGLHAFRFSLTSSSSHDISATKNITLFLAVILPEKISANTRLYFPRSGLCVGVVCSFEPQPYPVLCATVIYAVGNPVRIVRDPKERLLSVRTSRSTGHIMVTTRYSNQPPENIGNFSASRLVMSLDMNYSFFEMLPAVFENLNYKLQRKRSSDVLLIHRTKSSKVAKKQSSYRRVTRRRVNYVAQEIAPTNVPTVQCPGI